MYYKKLKINIMLTFPPPSPFPKNALWLMSKSFTLLAVAPSMPDQAQKEDFNAEAIESWKNPKLD